MANGNTPGSNRFGEAPLPNGPARLVRRRAGPPQAADQQQAQGPHPQGVTQDIRADLANLLRRRWGYIVVGAAALAAIGIYAFSGNSHPPRARDLMPGSIVYRENPGIKAKVSQQNGRLTLELISGGLFAIDNEGKHHLHKGELSVHNKERRGDETIVSGVVRFHGAHGKDIEYPFEVVVPTEQPPGGSIVTLTQSSH